MIKKGKKFHFLSFKQKNSINEENNMKINDKQNYTKHRFLYNSDNCGPKNCNNISTNYQIEVKSLKPSKDTKTFYFIKK